ncbi:MAG: SPFH domain-containing protein [Paludibacteraceae bacterium]|nr:SPFH domain-containing protein [Paludibacteraceae bacterium]
MVEKTEMPEKKRFFSEGLAKVFKIDTKRVVLAIVCVVLLILGLFSYDIIEPDERGVSVTLGEISCNEPIEPGIVTHLPFVTKIERFSVVPMTYEVKFSVGEDGAITKDMQTVGSTVVVRYNYDEKRIIEIVQKYRKSKIIEDAMRDCIKASLKEITGKYSIYDLIANQQDITQQLSEVVLRRMQDNYPIQINSTTITNFDWAEDFDRMIKETANRTQQVKQAEQEANVAAAQAQKKVREAEAERQAAEEFAKAEVLRAQGEADAQKIRADAQAYEAQKIMANMNAMRAQWEYNVNLERAKRWDGKEVPDAAYVVPGTGAVVPLTTK